MTIATKQKNESQQRIYLAKCFSQPAVPPLSHGILLVIKQPTCKSLLFQSSYFEFFNFFFIKTSNNSKIIRVATTFLDPVIQWRTCYMEWHTRDTATIRGPALYRAVLGFAQAVPFSVSSLCNLGPDILRKPRDKIAGVSAT